MYTRAVPLVVIASGAFITGIVVAAGPDSPGAQRFLAAWEDGDYAAMHAELTPAAKAEYSPEAFERAYERAADTATVSSLEVGDETEAGEAVVAPVRLETQAFGTIEQNAELPLSDGGIELGAASRLPRPRGRRAPGAPHACPAARRDPGRRPQPACQGTGCRAHARELDPGGGRRGRHAHARAGQGAHGGRLSRGHADRYLGPRARLQRPPRRSSRRSARSPSAKPQEGEPSGERILAESAPVAGEAVRTTIDPALQEATVAALGSLYGGAAVLDARNGEVRALAGLGYSAPQPPGSTFKVITASGALEAGIVKTSDSFPVEVSNTDIGREIANSHDSPCGGTFTQTFADSCNTVFAPLGVELGAEKLVETAELFGFNSPPSLLGKQAMAALDPPASTIPETLASSVEVGESAIGQGQVLATPLQMASVAQTIANGGVRSPTSLVRTEGLGPDLEPVEVTTPQTAKTMTDLMVEVVNNGTGVAAALPEAQVAGKTGTAELGPKALEPGQELGPGEEPEQELDAWFTAFAPAQSPKLAVAVMIVNSTGDGGEVAAPIAAQILQAGLG